MCGIFGHIILNEDFNLEQSRRSLQTLQHRGPNQWNDWFDESIYSGHRRLSILDLSERGRQPMIDENAVLTANGEIYNFEELRNELIKKYEFKSNSDSEVLLHGYREWGIEGLLKRIEGMFAFTIYDRKNKKVFLARDRVGIKPLYYGVVNNQWAWASELKALESFFGINRLEIDFTAIYDYLTYLYIPTPKTSFKNIYKLEPGHLIELDIEKGTSSKRSYWELPVENISISLEEAASELRQKLSKSVKEQMISDVPIGFFLSGGIDSSVVVYESSHLSPNINTYSIGFDVESHNETHFAEIIAKQVESTHHTKILDAASASKMSNRMKEWYDEPFSDTSAIPSFLVSQFAKETCSVVLTGDGGDEIFGGYEWYNKFLRLSKYHINLPSAIKKYISKTKNKNRYSVLGKICSRIEYAYTSDLELYAKLMGGLMKHEKTKYAKQFSIPTDYDDYWYFRKYWRNDLPPLKRLQFLDFHTYLPDDILTKVDRVTMSVALEARVPLLATDIITYAFSLPENILYVNNQLKGLLKHTYKDALPEQILTRKKKGFSIPMEQWNRNFLKDNSSQQEFLLKQFIQE